MSNPIRVLLIEDNPGDVELMRAALERSRICVDMAVALDGREAMDRLSNQGQFAEVPLPDLVLLDLNLPGMSGLELLSKVRQSPRLRSMPVVIITTSQAETDIAQAYGVGANAFVTKPLDVTEFMHAMEITGQFWFVLAKRRPPTEG